MQFCRTILAHHGAYADHLDKTLGGVDHREPVSAQFSLGHDSHHTIFMGGCLFERGENGGLNIQRFCRLSDGGLPRSATDMLECCTRRPHKTNCILAKFVSPGYCPSSRLERPDWRFCSTLQYAGWHWRCCPVQGHRKKSVA